MPWSIGAFVCAVSYCNGRGNTKVKCSNATKDALAIKKVEMIDQGKKGGCGAPYARFRWILDMPTRCRSVCDVVCDVSTIGHGPPFLF